MQIGENVWEYLKVYVTRSRRRGSLVAAVVRVSPKQRAIMIVYFIIFLKQTPTVPLNSRLREQFFCGHEQFWKILKFSLDVPIRMNLQ